MSCLLLDLVDGPCEGIFNPKLDDVGLDLAVGKSEGTDLLKGASSGMIWREAIGLARNCLSAGSGLPAGNAVTRDA